jgi:hypothetical protein
MELELGKIITEDISEKLGADDPGKVKKREFYFIKKLVIESTTYPNIEIEQFDLCPDGSEEFDIWIKICAHMTKDDLFEFLKTTNDRTASVLFYKDDQLPGKITIETFPRLTDIKEK